MVLTTNVTFNPEIGSVDSLTPEFVVTMLEKARSEVGSLEPSFLEKSLLEVLAIVESGTYTASNGGAIYEQIDFSAARRVTDHYRSKSEGGCKSCTYMQRQVIDAQDASSGWYCGVSDPQFVGGKVTHEGFSKKIKEHYENPCQDQQRVYDTPIEDLLAATK